MMHAKTSVVDGLMCRVGSSNLNSASLMGNWELDVSVFDDGLARQLQGLFLADLASSREIVLPGRPRRQVRPFSSAAPMSTAPLDPVGSLPERLRSRSPSVPRVAMASVVRARQALGGALAGNRPLGREDRTVLGTLAGAILIVAGLAALMPALVGWVVAATCGWFGLTVGVRAFLEARRARRDERVAERERSAPADGGRE
jgi:cardiolipin synthase